MKISLIINAHEPNIKYLNQAIDSAIGFDEIVLYINNVSGFDISLLNNKEVKIIYDGQNRNCADGFNYAISHATGDWVLPFCCNDYFITKNLKFILTFMRNNIKRLTTKHVIHYPCMVNGKDEWGEGFFRLEDIKQANCVPFSCIYRKSVWEEVGGYRNLPFNDWFFWMCVVKKGYKFFYNPNPVYVFRQEGNSLSDKERKQNTFEEIRQLLLKTLEEI